MIEPGRSTGVDGREARPGEQAGMLNRWGGRPTGSQVSATVGVSFQLGLATAVVGVATAHARFIAPAPYDVLGSSRAAWWLVVAIVLAATSYGLGLPELPERRRGAVVRSLGASAAAIVVVSLAQLVTAGPLLPRSSVGLLVAVVPLWSVICFNLAGDLDSWQGRRDRIFLVAREPDEYATLAYELAHRPERRATMVSTVPVGQARLGPDGATGLLDAVRASGASLIVLDTAAQADDGIVAQVARLHGEGVRVRTLALFYESWLGKLPLAELARVSLLFDIGELHRIRYVRSKRIIDLAIGLLGLVALGPVAVAVSIGNRIANRGPLLFSQPRVGKDGVVFTMHKFRTMEPTGSGGAGPWTAQTDPRITPFGRWLRRTHLDELPQVVNIVRGDLSLVGPRPEQPHYVEELSEKVPFYDVRHLVRPGLTGWAQVKQGYAAGEADALEKLQYDFFYLRRQGLALDARIVWRTVRGVVAGDGR